MTQLPVHRFASRCHLIQIVTSNKTPTASQCYVLEVYRAKMICAQQNLLTLAQNGMHPLVAMRFGTPSLHSAIFIQPCLFIGILAQTATGLIALHSIGICRLQQKLPKLVPCNSFQGDTCMLMTGLTFRKWVDVEQ